MLWIILTVISAFASAVADALCKKAGETNEFWIITWVRFGYAIPFLALLFFFINIPALDRKFWMAVGALIPLEIAAALLYNRAIQIAPLSLTVPFLSFMPLFLLLIPGLLLGEKLSTLGVTGIILVAFGAYLLNIHLGKQSLVAPIRAIFHEKGSRLMVGAAAIYSITSTLGKVALQHSSPLFFSVFYSPMLGVITLPFLRLKSKKWHRLVSSNGKLFLAIGLIVALMNITHFLAVSLTQVAYMVAVKRTAMIFTTLFGWLFFGEENIGERLLGSAVMLVGVVLISVG